MSTVAFLPYELHPIAEATVQAKGHILGVYGYGEYSRRNAPLSAKSTKPEIQEASSNYQCDGRTHCSQMTSCAEATFFLRNCPNVQMDGDNDGVACEQQSCTSPLAK